MRTNEERAREIVGGGGLLLVADVETGLKSMMNAITAALDARDAEHVKAVNVERDEAMRMFEKLAAALSFYRNNADCRSSVGFGVCRCAFCKGQVVFRHHLSDYEAWRRTMKPAPASRVPDDVIEALKFYADEETYEAQLADPYGDEGEWNMRSKPIESDEGKRARECLRKLGVV